MNLRYIILWAATLLALSAQDFDRAAQASKADLDKALAEFAELSGGSFGSHGSTDKYAVLPAIRLIDQGSESGPPSAEDDCRYGHAVVMFLAKRV